MKREEVFRSDPKLIGGAPAFTGTHVAVDNLIVHLKNGYSLDQFLEHFRGVSRQQVVAFLDMAEDALLSQEVANFAKRTPSPEIIETDIGPVISGRRVTVYDVMEAHDEGDNIYTISSTYNISPLHVKAAIEYIERHRSQLEPELKEILIKKAERERYHRALASEIRKQRPPLPMTPRRKALYALLEKSRRSRGEGNGTAPAERHPSFEEEMSSANHP
jgi:uncharacterized protein (DUF433 family)